MAFNENISLGMLLTIADAGTTSIQLHGPNTLSNFLAATRQFIFR